MLEAKNKRCKTMIQFNLLVKLQNYSIKKRALQLVSSLDIRSQNVHSDRITKENTGNIEMYEKSTSFQSSLQREPQTDTITNNNIELDVKRKFKLEKRRN